jgi:hypothetical protein
VESPICYVHVRQFFGAAQQDEERAGEVMGGAAFSTLRVSST